MKTKIGIALALVIGFGLGSIRPADAGTGSSDNMSRMASAEERQARALENIAYKIGNLRCK